MPPEKLAAQVNRIARFMASRPPAEAREGLAGHVNDYWDPDMRAALLALAAAGGAGLDPLVLEALPLIRVPAAG